MCLLMLIDFLIVVDPCKGAIAMDVYGFHIECSKIGFPSIYFVGEAAVAVLSLQTQDSSSTYF